MICLDFLRVAATTSYITENTIRLDVTQQERNEAGTDATKEGIGANGTAITESLKGF